MTVRKSMKLVDEGIDFNTFFNCNKNVNDQGLHIAGKIFKAIKTLDSKYINWEEYFTGLHTLRSSDFEDKIDLFLKIIDTDGNCHLSYKEVLSISIDSLNREFLKNKSKDDDEEYTQNQNEIVQTLASFFANLIFQLVERKTNEEIPIAEIKDKILKGAESEKKYLEMFICANSFT